MAYCLKKDFFILYVSVGAVAEICECMISSESIYQLTSIDLFIPNLCLFVLLDGKFQKNSVDRFWKEQRKHIFAQLTIM